MKSLATAALAATRSAAATATNARFPTVRSADSVFVTSINVGSVPSFTVDFSGACLEHYFIHQSESSRLFGGRGGDIGGKYLSKNHVTLSARSSSQTLLYSMAAFRAFSYFSSPFILTLSFIYAHPLTLTSSPV